MLLGQDGSGDQIYHLFTLLHGLESRPDSDLCFSVSHISADQTVHDLGALHIFFCRIYGGQLIFRLLKGEHFLKFPLPYGIRPILIAGLGLPCGIKLHQIPGDIFYRPFYLCFCLIPVLGSQLIQLRSLGVGPCIFLQQVQLIGKDVKCAVVSILNLDIILGHPVYSDFLNAPVNSQTMVFMYHIVSDTQFAEILDPLSAVLGFLPFFLFFLSENIRFRDHHKLDQRIFKAPLGMAEGGHDLSGGNDPVHIFGIKAV